MASCPVTAPAFDVFGLGPDTDRRDWLPFLAGGLALAAAGAIAGGLTLAIDPAAGWLVGTLLLLGGAVQVTTAARAWEWGGLRTRTLTGLIYLTLGALVLGLPREIAVGLTLGLVAALVVGGVVRASGAAAERFAGRGAVLASGLVAVSVGLLIGEEWYDAGLWAVGLLAGVDLAASGLAWVVFACGLRPTP